MADYTQLFKLLGVTGVFANLCEYKGLKTRNEKILTLTIDPHFGGEIVKMSGGDIPAYMENEVPVVVIPWTDFENLARRISNGVSKNDDS